MFRSFYIKLATENAAFDGSDTDCICETARMLRELADKLDNGAATVGTLRDHNGNRVGQYEFSGQPLAPFAQYQPE
jgi:hypothetical protein